MEKNPAMFEVRRASLAVIRSILSDANWQYFSYKRQPKIGTFFLRFIGKARKEKFEYVGEELFAMTFVDIVESIKGSQLSETNKLTLIGGVIVMINEPSITRMLNMTSDEFLSFLDKAHEDFTSYDFLAAFMNRVNARVQDPNNVKSLLVGSFMISAQGGHKESGLLVERKFLVDHYNTDCMSLNIPEALLASVQSEKSVQFQKTLDNIMSRDTTYKRPSIKE